MDATYKNFAMRSTVLRNCSFIIGIVVYVGTETKAHQNFQRKSRKRSWMLQKMHDLIVKMFFLLGFIVVLLTVESVIFD